MTQQLDRLLANHCAPVLADIKPANLASCDKALYPELPQNLQIYNKQLNNLGIYFELLCECKNRSLLYVYRPQALAQQLSDGAKLRFLIRLGYPAALDLQSLLAYLKKRIAAQQEFPHEIGLFLGYPLADVVGFQQNRGKNYLLSRYWKVYGDAASAQKLFQCYDDCRESFCSKVAAGFSIVHIMQNEYRYAQ